MQDADDKHVLLAVSFLGDVCANSNAPDALAAKLLSHSLGLLEVDVYNGNRRTCLTQGMCKGSTNTLPSTCKTST